MNINTKRRILITAGVLLVILIVFGFVLSGSPKPHQTAPVGLEKGFPGGQVGIQGAERLNEVLLPQEYSAVKGALSNYIRSKISPSVVSANIVPGTTFVNSDGSIDFSVQVAQPKKTFAVVLQRPSSSVIVFSIVGSNSEPTTLYPFGQP